MTLVRKTSSGLWVYDRDPVPPIAKYRIDRVLCETQTKLQHVGIYDLRQGGRALFLDGSLQSCAADEARYHECLVHPALLAHPNPERVLIAGGGEGATLREVLRHPCVREAWMVDLDPELVALSRRHLKSWSAGVYEDSRTRLRFADARGFLERGKCRFDVILCDLPEPRAGEPSMLLYTVEFYRAARRRLRPGGILVTQSGPVDEISRDLFLTVRATLRRVFKHVSGYWVRMPSFREPWGYLCASDGVEPARLSGAQIRERMEQRGIAGLRFYRPGIHPRLFHLPPAVASRMTRRVSTDAAPFVME